MDEIRFIRERYVELRAPLGLWLKTHLAGEAWYFRPTPVSTNAAWIVPHLVASEYIAVYTKVRGWTFAPVAEGAFIERYRGGAQGHTMGDAELLGLEEATGYLDRARAITLELLDAILSGSPAAANVDPDQVFERYHANFAHDTEHLGQLKYLAGTWARLHGA